MDKKYLVILSLNYGRTIDKSCATMQEAFGLYKKFRANSGVDFESCSIYNEWADEIFNCTQGGIETYFIIYKNYIHRASQQTFKTVHGIK